MIYFVHQGGASGWFVRLISFAMSRNYVMKSVVGMGICKISFEYALRNITKSAVMVCEFARFPSSLLLNITKSAVMGCELARIPSNMLLEIYFQKEN